MTEPAAGVRRHTGMRIAMFPAAAALAVLLTACSGSTTAHDPTSGSPTSVTLDDLGAGAWVGSGSDGLEGPDGPLVAHSRVTLTFDGDTVHASAGCNSFTGTASIDAGRLEIKGLGGTEMACSDALMGQEEWYTGFLSGSPAVELSGDTLTLTGGGDALTLTRLTDGASP